MKREILVCVLMCMALIACNDSSPSSEEKQQEEIQESIDKSGINNMQISTAHLLLKPALFKIKLDNDSDAVILDIRTPEELAENGTINGAQNVDFYEPNFKATIDTMDRDIAVMLYCRSGGRSGQAAAMMKEMGFKKVFDLNGGYDAWLEAGF